MNSPPHTFESCFGLASYDPPSCLCYMWGVFRHDGVIISTCLFFFYHSYIFNFIQYFLCGAVDLIACTTEQIYKQKCCNQQICI